MHNPNTETPMTELEKFQLFVKDIQQIPLLRDNREIQNLKLEVERLNSFLKKKTRERDRKDTKKIQTIKKNLVASYKRLYKAAYKIFTNDPIVPTPYDFNFLKTAIAATLPAHSDIPVLNTNDDKLSLQPVLIKAPTNLENSRLSLLWRIFNKIKIIVLKIKNSLTTMLKKYFTSTPTTPVETPKESKIQKMENNFETHKINAHDKPNFCNNLMNKPAKIL